VRNRDFWLLAGSFAICGATTNGLIGTHLIPACVDHGIPETTAAGLLALMGVFDVAGTMASGWLTDRIEPRRLLFWYYGLRGLSLMLLPSALGPGHHAGLLPFALFYGLDWVATVPPTVALCARAFGEERAGVVFGWVFASHSARRSPPGPRERCAEPRAATRWPSRSRGASRCSRPCAPRPWGARGQWCSWEQRGERALPARSRPCCLLLASAAFPHPRVPAGRTPNPAHDRQPRAPRAGAGEPPTGRPARPLG
jgi:hypothetical protein